MSALWAILSLSGCASNPVPNVRVCAEIPFVDGPEGACVWTVSQKTELVNSSNWAKERPTMLMIDGESWTEIKKSWLKACRMVERDGGPCAVQVDSVDKVVRAIDQLASQIVK